MLTAHNHFLVGGELPHDSETRTFRREVQLFMPGGDQRALQKIPDIAEHCCRDERWRPCDPTNPVDLFGEYLQKNEKLVREIVQKISARSVGGTFLGRSAGHLLDEAADVDRGRQLGRFFSGAPEVSLFYDYVSS